MRKTKRGVLSVWGDNEYPYGIPINYYYDEEDGWSFHVESVVVFGKASFVEDKDVLVDRAAKFARKYFPTEDEVKKEMNTDSMARMAIIKIDIEYMSGKSVHEK